VPGITLQSAPEPAGWQAGNTAGQNIPKPLGTKKGLKHVKLLNHMKSSKQFALTYHSSQIPSPLSEGVATIRTIDMICTEDIG
jgi:hypothetical protein